MSQIKLHESVSNSCGRVAKDLSKTYQMWQCQGRRATSFQENLSVIMAVAPSDLDESDLPALLKYFQEQRLLDYVPAKPKSNQAAARLRQEGNRLFVAKKFEEALLKYNESISLAENGSEELAISYGNRSAVCYESLEYEVGLTNIALAKQLNYPACLMAKLLNRESRCRDNLRAGESIGTVADRPMPINVEVNPSMPFLAKGLHMNPKTSENSYGLSTTRDFKAGDVILYERVLVGVVKNANNYEACSFCFRKFGLNTQLLTPCTGCTLYMYCSEECKQNAWNFFHRFECGVSEKIQHICEGEWSHMLGVKMFFYELTLFKDNLEDMMKHHEDPNRTKTDMFAAEYSEDGRPLNPKHFFDIIIGNRPPKYSPDVLKLLVTTDKFTAAICACLLQHPLVKSIFADERAVKFLLDTVSAYTDLRFHAHGITYYFTVGSCFTTSCDPNAVKVADDGQLKIVVIRPIRKGEEITVGTSFEWWNPDMRKVGRPADRGCQCDVCGFFREEQWLASVKGKKLPAAARKEWQTIDKVVFGADDFNSAAKFNAVRQFIERYAHVHPNKELGAALLTFNHLIHSLVTQEFDADLRRSLMADLDKQHSAV